MVGRRVLQGILLLCALALAALYADSSNVPGVNRVAFLETLEQQDPLFAIDGTAPDMLAESITRLETSRDTIASLYRGSERRMIEEALYPIPFLTDLVNAQRTRDTFLAHPSYQTAASYYGALARTLRSYESSLAASRETYAYIAAKSPDAEYQFVGGITTAAHYLTAIDALLHAASDAHGALAARMRCLFGLPCPPLPPAAPAAPEDYRATNALPAVVLEHEAVLDAARANTIPVESEKHGVIVFQKPLCGEEQPAYYEASYEQSALDGTRLHLSYLNDLYFFDTATAHFLDYPLLHARGATYFYQPIENVYICPDIAKRYAQIASLLAADAAPETKRAAILREQSGNLDLVVRTIVTQNRIVESFAEIGTPESFEEVMLSRSIPLLFFQAYNQTVIKTPPELLAPEPFSSGSNALLSYEKDLRRIVPLSNLTDVIVAGKRAEQSLFHSAR